MKFASRAAMIAAVSLMAACNLADQNNAAQPQSAEAGAIAPVLATPDAVDVHSFARPLEARVHHVALDLGVDFHAKRIGGTATLDIERKPDAKEIILDDKGLEIDSVANRYDPAVPSLEQFLGAQGRGKFVKPLIKALAADSSWGRPIAARIYAKTRPLYHPRVTRDLDQLKLLS